MHICSNTHLISLRALAFSSEVELVSLPESLGVLLLESHSGILDLVKVQYVACD